MADIADRAGDREEQDRAISLALRKPSGPDATGYCLNCDTSVPPGHRWFDADCRDMWQMIQRAGV